jgi:prepilin-type N-terminal cleavage/methylation domain-containing protein
MKNFQFSIFNFQKKRGYTLIELVVALGLFSFVMTLSSGAYLMMIGMNRQAQAVATGIDDLSFALEMMTRDMRTGSAYSCGPSLGLGSCPTVPSQSFSFRNKSGAQISYTVAGGVLQRTVNNAQVSTLTGSSVTISNIAFYVSGTVPGDSEQPHVSIIITGTVAAGPNKPPQTFTIETGATMRGTDI